MLSFKRVGLQLSWLQGFMKARGLWCLCLSAPRFIVLSLGHLNLLQGGNEHTADGHSENSQITRSRSIEPSTTCHTPTLPFRRPTRKRRFCDPLAFFFSSRASRFSFCSCVSCSYLSQAPKTASQTRRPREPSQGTHGHSLQPLLLQLLGALPLELLLPGLPLPPELALLHLLAHPLGLELSLQPATRTLDQSASPPLSSLSVSPHTSPLLHSRNP